MAHSFPTFQTKLHFWDCQIFSLQLSARLKAFWEKKTDFGRKNCNEVKKSDVNSLSRRWFQIFFIFIPTWGNDPIWLIFFKRVETTNQLLWMYAKNFLKRMISSTKIQRNKNAWKLKNRYEVEHESDFWPAISRTKKAFWAFAKIRQNFFIHSGVKRFEPRCCDTGRHSPYGPLLYLTVRTVVVAWRFFLFTWTCS